MQPHPTPAQARRIIACCQTETQRRVRGLARHSAQYLAVTGIGAETRAFMHQLADVEHAALAVLDGLEDAATDLQAALEAADYHPLWDAIAEAPVKRRAA